MSYCVQYTSDFNGDEYVFKVNDEGKVKGKGARMVVDEYGKRFEFFEFGARQLENIEEGLANGKMMRVDENVYLERMRKWLSWTQKAIGAIDRVLV